MNTFDLIIIGAGPAGLSCAIEAKKAGLNALVLDKGNVVENIQNFQRSMFFFSTPELLEIGGLPFVVPTVRPTTVDCVNYYRSVVRHFGIACALYEEVREVGKEGSVFVIRTARGSRYQARFVVVATGYYDTPTPLGVPGENLPHVTHYYRDPFPFFGRDVLVVGGKNSAVEAALDLWRHGARVTVVHRGTALSSGVKYWILPDFENRVAQGSIALLTSTEVRSFGPHSTAVCTRGKEDREIPTDAAFVLIGYRPNVPFLEKLGIAVDPDSLVPSHAPETMETNVAGMFIAGGIVGGRFNNRVFIENGREHAKKIIPSLLHRSS